MRPVFWTCLAMVMALPNAPGGQILTRERGGAADALIIVYHDLTADEVGERYLVPMRLFERHMAYLAENGFTSITPDDLARAARGEQALPDKPVMIQFDDWFPAQYELAVPVLDRYGLTGTFFIITSYVKDDADRAKVRDTAGRGHYIGSHSVNHFQLAQPICLGPGSFCCHEYRPCSEADVREELAGSRRQLEDMIGAPVNALAWPWGSANSRTMAIARESGYEVFFNSGIVEEELRFGGIEIGQTCELDEFIVAINSRCHCGTGSIWERLCEMRAE